jgi:ATP-binding cassette, subfamily B, bacterial MsbA
MREFLLKVWALTRPYRGRLLLGVLTGIIGGLIEPLMIASIGFVYGLIFPSMDATGAQAAAKLSWAPALVQEWARTAQEVLSGGVRAYSASVVALVALIPAIVVLRSVVSYLNIYFLQWTAVRAITDLRARMFEHLLNLSAGFFGRTGTGELISRTMADTGAIQNIISNATSVMVKDPVTLIGMMSYLTWRDWQLTHGRLMLVSMIVMPVCVVPILIFNRKVRRATSALQDHTAELYKVMIESFGGNRIVKAYNLEKVVLEQFRATARKFISHYMRIVRSSEIPGPLLEALGAVGVCLVLIYLAHMGTRRPQGEDMLVFVLGLFTMYRPIKNLARLYNSLESARAASQRAFEFLATKSDIPEPVHPKPLRAARVAIHFRAVDFSYGDKAVLRGINLTVEPGRMVALVGPSGGGKTTIANLLLRFYDPERGAILIGDTDIREVTTRDLRNQIAVVTQEIVLFNQTIARNIELGRPGATQQEIIEAAKHANAYDFIMERPKGFETVIGEAGTRLSGGQRQRLAIARAVLKNAPILLLDEATSSLDAESERAVQGALEKLMEGRTTICIAHRLSTIQKADLIVVLDRGRVVETGTHEQLLSLRGLYWRLYDEPANT